MKFSRFAPTTLIAASATLIAMVAGIGSVLTQQNLEHAKRLRVAKMQSLLHASLRSAEGKAVERAELLTSVPAVRAAFLHRDREALAASCTKMFEHQEKTYGLNTAQFHTPPGTSFLRLHAPGQFGDDQTSYRPILTDVSQNRAIRRGIALSRSGPSIYGVVPIVDDAGAYAGSFEMGLDLAPVLDGMKAQFGFETFAYIDETPLRTISTALPNEVLAPSNRTGRFLLVHATRGSATRELVTDRDVEARDPTSYERRADGSSWSVLVEPMYDYTGKQIGVFAIARDLTANESRALRMKIYRIASALVAVFAMSVVVLIVLRKLTQDLRHLDLDTLLRDSRREP